jgi:mannose-6-phosphate isomerase
VSDRLALLREAIRRPLPLAYHPLYRFYEGGSLTRAFRGLPERPDDWWSEDWVGSCTRAGNDGPDGRPQGLSPVDVPGAGPVTLAGLVEALPEEMVGACFAERWGAVTGVLVKLLSPAGQVPLHAHPTRAWARKHLGSPFGKTEAWILLDTPGDGAEPAYAGIGFTGGIDRDWFAGAVRRHDNQAIRGTLHRTDVRPGEVYVAHAGVPHYLGPRISFIEVQEPSDHIVIPETDGADDAGATMGLGWDLALDMIDYAGADAGRTFARARQQPRVLRSSGASRETRLLHDDVLGYFDATVLDVADEIEVSDGRFSVAVVVSGDGAVEGDFGRWPVRRGETFALPASLPVRVRAGREPVRVVRCLGPQAEPFSSADLTIEHLGRRGEDEKGSQGPAPGRNVQGR